MGMRHGWTSPGPSVYKMSVLNKIQYSIKYLKPDKREQCKLKQYLPNKVDTTVLPQKEDRFIVKSKNLCNEFRDTVSGESTKCKRPQ